MERERDKPQLVRVGSLIRYHSDGDIGVVLSIMECKPANDGPWWDLFAAVYFSKEKHVYNHFECSLFGHYDMSVSREHLGHDH